MAVFSFFNGLFLAIGRLHRLLFIYTPFDCTSAGAASTVKGYTQEDLAEQVAAYRETVTNAIHQMKANGFIEVGRKRITIVDKRALRELSEL